MKKLFITLLILCSSMTFAYGANKNSNVQKIDEISQQARVYYAQNDIDEAFKILSNKPEDERSAEDWLLLGNIMQDKDKIPEAIYMFNQSINKNPKFYKAHYNLGYIYFIQDKPNMALSEFKTAVRYKPDFAYGYYNIGCAYIKLKKYGTAKYNLFKALDLKANEPDIYYNISYAYKMMGKEKQAKTYLDLYNKMMENHDL
ncbi:hypothetical protein J6G99_06225 [bacterium]|nr:hypothetical protein [bacterium]